MPHVPMARNYTYVVARPLEADASRIAEIHVAAMDSNPLLHAQFPTSDSLVALQRFLEADTADRLRNPTSGFLVARDPEAGTIAGFVRWDSPSHPEHVKLESGSLRNLEGCRREFLDEYSSRAAEAKRRSFCDNPCYCLSFVCVDPLLQGRGTGSLLARKVLEMADADGLPVYLECTEVAVPMYEKLGFRGIDSFEMRVPRYGLAGQGDVVYRELCMTWYPAPKEQQAGVSRCQTDRFEV
ncbi:N-acetyltransferase domain-containing protein [Madurella fahalii]|uniref:N-acetyltransferase domain-containing protein n=1 Tax=Madurella fahalii TaxID=1157608 RepID=A0ABQ0GDK2_9PEZI